MSYLDVGIKAIVSTKTNQWNNVRSMPYINRGNNIIGRINPGESVLIMDGPSCSSGYIWWKVQSEQTGLVGWSVEGGGGEYWLLPK